MRPYLLSTLILISSLVSLGIAYLCASQGWPALILFLLGAGTGVCWGIISAVQLRQDNFDLILGLVFAALGMALSFFFFFSLLVVETPFSPLTRKMLVYIMAYAFFEGISYVITYLSAIFRRPVRAA